MAGSISLARVSASERATPRIITDAAEVGADALDRSQHHSAGRVRERAVAEGVETVPQTRAPSPLGRPQNSQSEGKEGGTQTREQWSPLLVSGSLINEPREERYCVSR